MSDKVWKCRRCQYEGVMEELLYTQKGIPRSSCCGAPVSTLINEPLPEASLLVYRGKEPLTVVYSFVVGDRDSGACVRGQCQITQERMLIALDGYGNVASIMEACGIIALECNDFGAYLDIWEDYDDEAPHRILLSGAKKP